MIVIHGSMIVIWYDSDRRKYDIVIWYDSDRRKYDSDMV